MVMTEPSRNLFSFLGPDHPAYLHLAEGRALMSDEPRCVMFTERVNTAQGTKVRTLMKCDRAPESGWKIKWFYVLFQSNKETGPLSHYFLTLVYRVRKRRLEVYEFPQDPYLPHISLFLEKTLGKNGRVSNQHFAVLRYVPRHRLTFRLSPFDQTKTPMIGKFVRRTEVKETYDKLSMVNRAVERVQPSFSVAIPLGIDEQQGLFFQQVKAGQNVACLLNKNNYRDLLFTIGTIHQEIHGLEIPCLPVWDFGSFLQEIEWRVGLISFLRPDEGPFLNHLQELLLKNPPRIALKAYTFCHGDFGCNQVLKEGKHWSVIDFDGCLRGDRYREMARLIAFLKHNVPLFMNTFQDPHLNAVNVVEEATESYLRGYQERAKERLNWKRLLWYRIACEIHYLARTLQRDLFHPLAFERTRKLLHVLADRFRKEEGDEF